MIRLFGYVLLFVVVVSFLWVIRERSDHNFGNRMVILCVAGMLSFLVYLALVAFS